MLLNKLPELLSQLNNAINNLNYGGCAVAAGCLASRLQHLVPTRVVVYDNDHRDITTTRTKVDNPNRVYDWNSNGVYFGHVLCEIDVDGTTYIMDSHGIFPLEGYTVDVGWEEGIRAEGFLTVEECVNLYKDPHGWNSSFNRHQIPTIEKMINNFFDNNFYALIEHKESTTNMLLDRAA